MDDQAFEGRLRRLDQRKRSSSIASTSWTSATPRFCNRWNGSMMSVFQQIDSLRQLHRYARRTPTPVETRFRFVSRILDGVTLATVGWVTSLSLRAWAGGRPAPNSDAQRAIATATPSSGR